MKKKGQKGKENKEKSDITTRVVLNKRVNRFRAADRTFRRRL